MLVLEIQKERKIKRVKIGGNPEKFHVIELVTSKYYVMQLLQQFQKGGFHSLDLCSTLVVRVDVKYPPQFVGRHVMVNL
jgi:hypothetical protein